ncbi:hypothetical protein ACEQ8H_001528 [Pleosporales sp. CAS-2024a]
MNHDDALPPPIRRSPRAALERQVARIDDDDDDFDQAAPVVPRSRSASLGVANFSRLNFSRPFWEGLRPLQVTASEPPPPVTPPVPHRSPARLKSYRANKRQPPHLRRPVSLETINSVTTIHSIVSDDEPDPPEASAPSPNFFTLDHDPTSSRDLGPNSPKSVLQKFKSRSLSGSSQSLQTNQTTSPGLFNTERNQSGSSSEWSASNFDMSTLSEAEMKKCKKKGINPALYAEMRAARKGKWTSPIAGNSFL